jgi:hypothetical protein
MGEDIGEAVKWASDLWIKEKPTLGEIREYYAVLKEYHAAAAMGRGRTQELAETHFRKSANAATRFNQAQQVVDLYSKLADRYCQK